MSAVLERKVSEIPGARAAAPASQPDQKVDLFSTRGFDLACRIAKAFAASNAVPAQFRQYVEKKVGLDTHWVENESAMGNCIVAIEVAQAVGMSITAVMQNADVIEGKLRWSGKFVIAAINASGRFSPLRFDMQNLGPITAKYKEKAGWNQQAKRYDMVERTVEVENVQCIAWATPSSVPIPHNINTLAAAKAAGLPVIESAPVTMKLVVEEGWYAKAGSKWQTDLKHLMFVYRAGTFFGNVHAPDIVMGMGHTAEEARDIVDLVRADDGSFSPAATAAPAATDSPAAASSTPPAGGDAVDSYPQDKFDANLPKWLKLIADGKKTVADIIAMAESKHPLTPAQKTAIEAPAQSGADQGNSLDLSLTIAAIRSKAKAAALTDAEVAKHLGIQSLDDMKLEQGDAAIAFINDPVGSAK